jgi:hypothetical protein
MPVFEVEPAGEARAIPVGSAIVVEGVEIPPPAAGARTLDQLTDVEGADAASVGQVLAKQGDGQWRPTTISDGGGPGGPLSHLHTQDSPSTVWLITHGLPFNPSGVEVRDHVGEPHYPVVSWPDGLTVRLDFTTSVRGTARLS